LVILWNEVTDKQLEQIKRFCIKEVSLTHGNTLTVGGIFLRMQ